VIAAPYHPYARRRSASDRPAVGRKGGVKPTNDVEGNHLPEVHDLTPGERKALRAIIHRGSVSRDINQLHEEDLTLGRRLADRVTNTLGSWTFIIVQTVILATWIVLNVLAWINHWDPYPFIFLNLALSFQAAYSAPIIMMSQNRQALKDRAVAANDYEVNLRSEMEVALIHERLDELVDRDWQALVKLQEEQLELLKRIDALTSEIHQRWANEKT
jgi:uncharacterized membrane protein